MVRVNTDPGDQGNDLSERLEPLHTRLEALRQERARHTEELADRLYAMAGTAPAEEKFAVILPCRRAVLADRDLPPVWQQLSGLTNRMAAWADIGEQFRKLSAELANTTQEALVVERQRLQRALGRPDFLTAAAMTSPALAHGAWNYARTPLDAHTKKIRKTEGKLLRYAQRAACKTSPFSQYTVVALAHWLDRPGTTDRLVPTAEASHLLQLRRARVSAGLVPALQLIDTMVAHPDAVAYLPLVPADRLRRRDGYYEVTVPVQPRASTNLYGIHRTEIRTRRSKVIDTVVDLLTSCGPMTGGEICNALADHGLIADSGAVLAFLARLVGTGLLRVDLALDQQSEQPLRQFAERLRDCGGDRLRRAADHLSSLHDQTEQVAVVTGRERAVAMDSLAESWSRAFRSAGREAQPSNWCYEDVVLSEPVGLVRGEWQGVLDDLASLVPLLEPFNVHHVSQAVLRSAFRERFGDGGSADWQQYLSVLQEAFKEGDPTYAGMVGRVPPSDTRVRSLIEARERAMTAVADLLCRAGREHEVEICADMLAYRKAGPGPECVTPAVTAFLQVTDRGVGGTVQRAVVNALLDGNAMFLSRFLDLFDPGSSAAVRRHLGESLPSGATELRPVHGFNANVHRKLLPAEFVDDAYRRRRSSTDLDPRSCRVVHDMGADRLALLDSDGRARTPVYSGLLIPYLFPWAIMGLYLLSDAGQLRFDPVAEIDRAKDTNLTCHYPAIRYGRLVLSRERWYLARADLPDRQPQEPIDEFALRIWRWRKGLGIPSDVFIAPLPARGAGDGPRRISDLQRPKPVAVRLDSPLHCQHLNAWLGTAERLRIEPADPARPAQGGPADPNFGSHAVEYVFELFLKDEKDA